MHTDRYEAERFARVRKASASADYAFEALGDASCRRSR
jgi:hypothetical protein